MIKGGLTMKIIFDEKDKNVVEKYKNGDMKKYGLSLPFISEHSTKCSLELKINDPYKCGVFLGELFHRLREYTIEECGFEISAVSLIGVHSDLQNLDEDILEAVNSVIKKHNL